MYNEKMERLKREQERLQQLNSLSDNEVKVHVTLATKN